MVIPIRRLVVACTLGACLRAVPAVAAQDPATIAIDTLLAAPAPAEATGALTLSHAMELTGRHHPALRGAAWSAKAAERRRRDAGRWSNPILDVQLENVGGSLPTDRREITAAAEQTWELGGKRSSRAATADALAASAAADFSAEARAELASTVERFLDAWLLQERARRLARAEHVAAEAIEAARQRFRAGAGPEVEATRAEVVQAQREADGVRVRAELAGAARRLANQWGALHATFDSLVLDAPEPGPTPSLVELAALLQRHPDRNRAAAAVAVEAARMRETRAARVPDLALRGGVRHLAEQDGTGFVAGVSLPLPLWSRQAGNVSASEAEQAAAGERERWIALRLEQELAAAHERYLASQAVYDVVRTRVAPKSEQAYRQVMAGYRGGRLSSIELLAAQRSVLDGELALIDAWADVWRARHALERLIGASLDSVPSGEGER